MPAQRDVLVLCYHAVSDTWPADLAISAAQLGRQLEFLTRRGYRGATFADAVSFPPHPRTLVVTFDDAYRSTLTQGKPVLDRLGLPATVFVPTAFPATRAPLAWPGIDQWLGSPHESELEPLSWQELASLTEAGWEIGSHTVGHPHLTRVDDETLAYELGDSRRVCIENLGVACRSIAYPYGDVDERVVSATQAAGYEAAAALPARLHRATALRWPRIGVYSIDTPRRFGIKVSPLVRSLRSAAGV
jgi:peptidoglycan/xylan/chitin deacetylase (PgdA/CDA1 family)